MNKKKMLILGGNDKINISWIEEKQKEYNINYNVEIIKYDNWFNNEIINFDNEINKISSLVDSKNIDVVIAKSIGILLSLKAIKRNILAPKIIIFMGYPLNALKEEKINIFNNLLELGAQTKMLMIQQNEDPLCHAKKLKELITDKIPIINIDGNDHTYNEIKIIKKYIDEFIES